MTYLAIGYKYGYGPGVWVVKDDSTDYLTTSPYDFGKFFFNSEIQAISYTKAPWKQSFFSTDGAGWNYIGGSAATCSRAISTTSVSGLLQSNVYSFPQKLFPGDAFRPITEARIRDRSTGKVYAAKRDKTYVVNTSSQQHGIVTAYQFPAVTMTLSNTGTGDWHGQIINSDFSGRIGEWFVRYGDTLDGRAGGSPTTINRGTFSGNTYPDKDIITITWDLPADDNGIPIPTAPVQAGQENVRLDSNGFIVTRPGFTVDGSAGRQRVIDSTRNPPLCIMAGETGAIGSGGSFFVAGPPGIDLSYDTVVDIMARTTSTSYYVPAWIITGYTPNYNNALSYIVSSNGITFYNDGEETLIVRYAVFGVDFRAPSTGGSEIMRRANDGTRDYIQIKKPGSSDAAPLPNDILLDTRFPTLQIVSEGYLPIGSFNEAADDQRAGNVGKTVSFTNSGFWPFLKYSIYFGSYILPPMWAEILHYPSGAYNHRPTNQSCVARVEDTYVKFNLSPGNPSNMTSPSSGQWELRNDYPDPLGIRYYIFAIPR